MAPAPFFVRARHFALPHRGKCLTANRNTCVLPSANTFQSIGKKFKNSVLARGQRADLEAPYFSRQKSDCGGRSAEVAQNVGWSCAGTERK